MMRGILIVVVIWLGAFGPPAISYGETDDNCCCCKNTGNAATTPELFATGCYQGSSTDDRRIATGIPLANAGLLRICELTAEAGNSSNCTYTMPGLAAGLSCATVNADYDPGAPFDPCGTNRIQALGDQYFEIGSDVAINTIGRIYCWEAWGSKAGWHGDVVYTGDGTADRSISISGGTPSMAIVWSRVLASSAENIPWIRTTDMAAFTSMPGGQNGTANDVQRIRNFTAGNVVVGTNSNVTSREYHLAWFGATSNQALTTYTGNGTSLDAGRCGSLADTQTIIANCTPVRNTWLTTTQGVGKDGACTLTRPKGYCNRWRSTATGFSVVGPGNISNASDLYAYDNIQPNNSGPGLLGVLSGASYKITGGPNLVDSCNDDAAVYYGMTTCGTAPSIGAQNPADWTFDTALVNWNMEDASSGTRINNAILGFCSVGDCDLANTDTVLKDTILFKQGTASAGFSGGTDRLSCSLATCSALKLTSAVTVMGWLRPNAASDCEMIESESGLTQYRMNWRNASQGVRWTITPAAAGPVDVTSSGWATGIWRHATGTFSDAGNSMVLYVDGTSAGSDTPADMKAFTNGTFEVGGNPAPNCNLDEVAVWNKALIATDICRIHACGIDGLQCSCLATDPTVYVSTGRWTPGACVLPACNKASPT